VPATKPPLTVYAAASLTDVLNDAGAAFERRTGTPVRFSFASSSLLAKQIEAGTRADAFVSADQEWMDYLASRAMLRANTRVNVASNRLVLVAPSDSAVRLKIAPGFPIASALGGGRLALGDPASVPAGRYARTALTNLGVWASVEGRVAAAENVRAALTFVARGEAPLGVVYATDAQAERRVRVVDTFPADTHPPVTYPAAVLASATAEAAAFVTFLTMPEAQAIFARYGFLAPPGATTTTARNDGAPRGCDALPWPMEREVALFSTAGTPVTAGTDTKKAPTIAADALVVATLRPRAAVAFARPPEKPRGDAATYAGLLTFRPDRPGTYRVTLSAPAWIDAVSAGAIEKSSRFAGMLACASIHKSVEYVLGTAGPVTLQFSGSPEATLRVAVTRIE
jgi:molybdate transport system substrate-binding protein